MFAEIKKFTSGGTKQLYINMDTHNFYSMVCFVYVVINGIRIYKDTPFSWMQIQIKNFTVSRQMNNTLKFVVHTAESMIEGHVFLTYLQIE